MTAMTTEEEAQQPKDSFRIIFGRGLVLIIPLVITLWVLNMLFNAVDGIISPLFDHILGQHIPGLGFASMILLIIVIGILSRNLIGRALFRYFERFMSTLPLARTIYSSTKDLINAFRPGGTGRSFRQVVLIEYPRLGMLTVGFVTNEISVVGDPPSGSMISVYIPNPPNPTSGVLVLVARDQVRVLNMTVEEGLKYVLSGGIVSTGQFTVRNN
jgi:uncharacterized membrane protein